MLKKLTILILIITTSATGFGQTDTSYFKLLHLLSSSNNISAGLPSTMSFYYGRLLISNDTVCIPRVDAIRVLTRLEYLKADSMEHEVTKGEVIDLRNIVNSQRTSITNLTNHVQTLDLRISTYQMQVNDLTGAIKKQKRKTMLATISGIILSGGLAYLFITK